MFRKIVLAALLATGIFGTLAVATPAVTAAAPAYRYHDRAHRGHDHRVRFKVVYDNRGCWDVYGNYANRIQAERAAHKLRDRHFAVRIDRERF